MRLRSVGELEITLRISAVAACCSSASPNSRVSRARSVCLEEFLRRAALGASLRLRWVGFASRFFGLRLAVGCRLTSPSLGGRLQLSTAAGGSCSTAKLAADVRFGSKADIEAASPDVRFTPESRH